MQLLSLTSLFLTAVLSNNALALDTAADSIARPPQQAPPPFHAPPQVGPILLTKKDCTSTIVRMPHFNAAPTSTVYKSTVTVTASVDCGGCSEVAVVTRALGHGPVVHHTTTTTIDASTATKEVCTRKAAKAYRA